MIKSLLALAILTMGLVTGACGSTSAAADPPVALGQGDDGRTISVARGTVIELTLQNSFGPPGSSLTWDAVSSDAAVLTRSAVRLDPASSAGPMLQGTQRYIADFRAAASGSARIVATGTRRCEAMNPAFCHGTTMSVTVTVTG
ncbi:MAG TPA: hypothetical protein VET65_04100 [Candidatus Limnocylindrales bacterium]|nr:hypothetical protein [Candidatus Limnocylindrales bacterium]